MGTANLTPLVKEHRETPGDSLYEVVDGQETNLRIAMKVGEETPITENARESAIEALVRAGVARDIAERCVEKIPGDKEK